MTRDREFRLDPFQQQAIGCIRAGESVLVCAPTGSGKTLIAEQAIDEAIQNHRTVAYTAPIKALSNQKYRDFSERYGSEHVGILTGDVTINRTAPILLMTTEILRNTIFEDARALDNVGWVIFDEIHYLDDLERGTVWEEALLFCPSHIRLVGLSATVPNADQLGQWIERTHGSPVRVIIERHRPVPLHHRFQCDNRVFDSLPELKKVCYPGGRAKKFNPDHPLPGNRLETLFKHIHELGELPCIYFVFSRKRTETIAWEIARILGEDPDSGAAALEEFDALARRFGIAGEKNVQQMRPLISCGAAFHHAGMLPSLKEVVERLFTRRLIRVICTTETFALGINMPVKSVVFDELRKFYGTGFGTLRTRDYYQMAGRAGRRGIDRFGVAYSRVIARHIQPHELERVVHGRPEPVTSRFGSTYAVLISLYGRYGEKLVDVYPRSFHYFQADPGRRKRAVRQMLSKLDLLKRLGYLGDGVVFDRGHMAARLYGYELVLTELYFAGFFDALDETETAALLSAVIFEPRPTDDRPTLNPRFEGLRKQVRVLCAPFFKLEKEMEIFPSKPPAFHLAPVIIHWEQGKPLEELTAESGFDPGTLVRYFRMVVQVCRQMMSITGIDPRLADKLRRCIRRINRDEVDAEKELREAFAADRGA